jgi:hypothetical protein
VVKKELGNNVIDSIQIGLVKHDRFEDIPHNFKYKAIIKDSLETILDFYDKEISAILVSNLVEDTIFMDKLIKDYNFKYLSVIDKNLQYKTLLGKPQIVYKNTLRRPRWK